MRSDDARGGRACLKHCSDGQITRLRKQAKELLRKLVPRHRRGETAPLPTWWSSKQKPEQTPLCPGRPATLPNW